MSESSPLHRAQPWWIQEEPDCFIIVDAVGFPIGRIFFAEDEQRRAETGQMSRDQALKAAERIVAAPATNAALRDGEKMPKAYADERTRTLVPRILN